jgi:hypothetical protein
MGFEAGALCAQNSSLADLVVTQGYAFAPGSAMALSLAGRGLTDWEGFTASWNDLGIDRHMADGGRYRRRRHAVFRMSGGHIERLPHRPHFQLQAHNPLNGGVERWFDPIKPEIATHPAFTAILRGCADIFTSQFPAASVWEVETHQFRIEANPFTAGKPAPEGMHRDGVDFVCVMLVGRSNVTGGETVLEDTSHAELFRRCLRTSMDAIFLDDRRLFHLTGEIRTLGEEGPSFRDSFVVTFRAV